MAGHCEFGVPSGSQVQVVGWPLQAVGVQKQQVVPNEQPIVTGQAAPLVAAAWLAGHGWGPPTSRR